MGIGLNFFMAGQYDRAIEQFRSAIQLDSGFPVAHSDLGGAQAEKGGMDQAVVAFQKGFAITPNNTGAMAELAYAYASSGRRDEALKLLARVNELAAKRYVQPWFFALMYAGLNDPIHTMSVKAAAAKK
jgi:Flp pilus assembly protein TadD